MSTPVEPSGHLAEFSRRLLRLATEADRRVLLEDVTGPDRASLLKVLCADAARLLRVDLQQAKKAAETAEWLAVHLKDDCLRGLSLRARANVLHVSGETAESVAAYERAVELFEVAGDEQEVALTQSSGIQAMGYLGRYDQALKWANAAGKTFRRLEDRLRLARLEDNIGAMLYRQDRFEEAYEQFQSAYTQLCEVGEPQDVAHCLGNLATTNISLNRFVEAEKDYREARHWCEKAELPLLLAEFDYNLAYLHFLRGNYTEAIELYRATRLKCEETGERYLEALCDLDESEIYLELNLVEEAIRAAEAAFQGFDHQGKGYEKGKALVLLAVGRARQGRLVLCIALLDEARQVFAAEGNRLWVAISDLYRAVALFREGRRFEAERLAAAALEVFAAVGRPVKAAACDLLLARLRLQGGDLQSARGACTSALERVHTLDLPNLEFQANFIHGLIDETAGDLESAIEYYKSSQALLELWRHRVGAEDLKMPVLEDGLQVYESLISVLGENEREGAESALFGYIENAKARQFSDLIAFRGLELPAKKAPRSVRAERVRRLREELNWYYRRLDLHEVAKEEQSAEQLEQLRTLSRRSEEELAQTMSELEATDREFTLLQGATTTGVEEIRSTLKEGTQLLEYYVARDTVFACLLDRESLEVSPVTLAPKARDLQQQFLRELERVRSRAGKVRGEERLPPGLRAVLQELYRELVEPFENRLIGGHLVIIPHRFLHKIPFHALLDGDSFLMDRLGISYSPTAQVFQLCQSRDYPAAEKDVVLAAGGSARTQGELNAAAVARALPKATVLEGEAASIENLKLHGRRCRILHLETRANFRQDNPMFSTLQLAGGRLSFFDLFGFSLETDLTVVSGMGSDLDRITEAHEWTGLAHGLVYAGSRAVLLPLWDLPPQEAERFLIPFYRRLADSGDRVSALKQTMLEIRERTRHPYFWASFVLIGAT